VSLFGNSWLLNCDGTVEGNYDIRPSLESFTQAAQVILIFLRHVIHDF
jgi:hypothetical protein